MPRNCERCGCGMHHETLMGIEQYKCWTCGNVFYPLYPRREAPKGICEACGEPMSEARQRTCAIYCDNCSFMLRASERQKTGIMARENVKTLREVMEL